MKLALTTFLSEGMRALNKRRSSSFEIALILSLAVAGSGRAHAQSEAVSFQFDIRPILSKNCFACHGPDEAHLEGDLRLDVADVPIERAAIVPGSPEESELVRRITNTDPEKRMPPVETGRQLSTDDISKIEKWIANGAKYSRHWSYEAPRQPTPTPSNTDWGTNEIDKFVLAKLEQAGLRPEPEADRYRLIRRLSLDLVGLPPSLEEVDAFVTDQSADAYERLVDRLLASPAYGEHFARKWLDLARYADTNGYEADKRRTMWPYRDWVIDSLNADMPYDEFTIEQIAGDLLPQPTERQLIATAFHRNTMQNDEGGTDDEEFRVAAVIDRVNSTMQVWMGTTIGCCQCHSHKYDPISHREYYQLFAFFNQTEDADRDDHEPTLATARVRSLRSEPSSGQSKDSRSAEPPSSQQKVAPNDLAKIPIMQELPTEGRRTTRVFHRGSFLDPGEEVTADTPKAFPALPSDVSRNRLALARWLVDRGNPLTARVAVNRQWEQLFGTGIVLTSEDFGSQGTLPSHPDLLDWLAIDFMNHGWSPKHLTKTIVMSATYRQSSRTTPEKLERDPDNRLFSHGPCERLSAEQIRDQALAVSGLLSSKRGGPSVMPPQPEGVWQMVYNDDRWQAAEGEDRYRRAIYTFWRRTSPYPSAMALDATSRETCTIRRVTTNTPVAAFALLNDPVYVEAAQALARRVVAHEEASLEARAEYAFRLVVGRPAEADEAARIVSLYASEREHYRNDPHSAALLATSKADPPPQNTDIAELAAWTVVSNVLLNLDETLTK